MKIIYRTSENQHPVNGTRPDWCMAPDFKIKCFKSLVDAIGNNPVTLYVVGDLLSAATIEKYQRLHPALTILNSKTKTGNQESLYKVFKLADTFSNSDDIIYFCEDDYLHLPTFYEITTAFFQTIGNRLENIFFHPTDYPDQYTSARIRRNYIFSNNLGGWYREVDSTTFTFACNVKTYRTFNRRLKSCALKKKIGYDAQSKPVFSTKGADDGRLSEIFGYHNGPKKTRQTAFCFCPLPGQASHMHTGTTSLHYDWEKFYNSIIVPVE